MRSPALPTVVLGDSDLGIDAFVAVARGGAAVELSPQYLARVNRSRALVEKFLAQNRLVYGVTTGFGENVTQVVSPADAQQLQHNIVRSHAVSVGEPLEHELVRAVQLMLLVSLGQGYSGVRAELLALIAAMLNRGVVPYAPADGSVGYLAVEAHMALVLIGEGQAWFDGRLMPGAQALAAAGLAPLALQCKEGLALTNGTTSVTAIAAMALKNAKGSCDVADIAAAMSLEGLRGTARALDARYHLAKAHPEQRRTAARIANLLQGSALIAKNLDYRLQDSYCLRGIPQIHAACRQVVLDAQRTIELEMCSTGDNPIVFPTDEGDDGIAMSGANFDGTYVGMAVDALCVAMTNLAKVSERRTDRMVNPRLSELPAFLVKNPGLNSGYMIAQYTAAGLVSEMRILSHPATTDSIPTSGNQEDPVSFAYGAALKAYRVSRKLEIVLAIELMAACQALDFFDPAHAAPATHAVYQRIRQEVPTVQADRFFHPDIVAITEQLRSGAVVAAAQTVVGAGFFAREAFEGQVYPLAPRSAVA